MSAKRGWNNISKSYQKQARIAQARVGHLPNQEDTSGFNKSLKEFLDEIDL
jgi:hypothetical protein